MMLNSKNFFKKKIDILHQEKRYRVFTHLERIPNKPAYAVFHPDSPRSSQEAKIVTIWCSNDYLGLIYHPDIIQAQQNATATYGTSSGGTRNISGSALLHKKLEKEIALLHGKESALLFSSGYVANEATLETLGNHIEDLIFLSDSKVHASMIQGMRHSKAKRIIFAHNDLNDLEHHLKLLPYEQPKLIVFVSVYSMDGDFGRIQEICDLAQRYNALTYLDEVHGVGVYGAGGGGVAVQQKQNHRLSIIQGNFAKAFGSFGGYIASSYECIDFIRSYASGFIFTTSLPPCVTAASLKSLEILKKEPQIQDVFYDRVAYLKNKLQLSSLNYQKNESHIISILIGDADLCKTMSDKLLFEHNIYVQPINYPTVERGTERFRVTVTPHHTHQMIDDFVHALECVWSQMMKEKKAAA